jgi:ABC-2 type transport system permease protein
MFTEFKFNVARMRGQIIGWGIGLFLLGLLLVPFFDSFAEDQQTFEQLLDVYPEEFTSFFGDFSAFATPEGFLEIEFFSFMPLVLGIFGVMAGSGLIASDEESGRLDLIMSHPIRRYGLLVARIGALVLATILICGIAWVGIIVPMEFFSEKMNIPAFDVLLPFISLASIILLFSAISLLLSLILPSRRMAGMMGGLILVGSFFLTGLSGIIEELEQAARFSPLNYYQGGGALTTPMEWGWIAGILGVTLLLIGLSIFLYQRKDIRIAGEGGLSLRLPWRKAAAS